MWMSAISEHTIAEHSINAETLKEVIDATQRS